VEQYTEKQYDDDLTVVADEYNDSFQTDTVDLFEFPSYDESPIARLKSLVLSIDWEITDDVLRQFNEELLDLKDIWANEKIYLVYVQALEKISKYIYQEKADSNPNAIKLLLTFYYNLEKIISSEDMSEEEKKQILLEDVQKFEKLKQQIGRASKGGMMKHEPGRIKDAKSASEAAPPPATHDLLLDLKAIVLGIDWEITEKELGKLRDEVIRLEGVFAGSRPKLIFLQGIGTIGAYIRLKKSDAHADAFKLLHSFFAGLEKIVNTPLSLEEEKAILFPEVEKFNAFKALVGSTIAPETVKEEREEEIGGEEDEDEEDEGVGGITPAFSDLPEEETRGFQEDEEAAALGLPASAAVSSQIDMFFSEEPPVDQIFVEKVQPPASQMRDERDEFRDAAEAHLDSLFEMDAFDELGQPALHVDQETALRGVDVETEADDDSGEEDLPLQAGKLAPALAALDEEGRKEVKGVDALEQPEENAGDLDNRLDDFFGEKEIAVTDETELAFSDDEIAFISDQPERVSVGQETSGLTIEALQGVDVETEEDEEIDEDALALAEGDLPPALSEGPVAGSAWETESAFDEFTETAPPAIEPAPSFADFAEEDLQSLVIPDTAREPEAALEEHLDSFFALDEEPEKPPVPVEDALEEAFEQQIPAIELSAETAESARAEEFLPESLFEEEPVGIDTDMESALAAFDEEEFPELQPDQGIDDEKVRQETEVEALIVAPEVSEEEVVFELAEEEAIALESDKVEEFPAASDSIYTEPAEEIESPPLAFEQEVPGLWQEDVSAEATAGDVDFFAEISEQEEDLAESLIPELGQSLDIESMAAPVAAFIQEPEPSPSDERDSEFLAVFEGVDEETEEDVLPGHEPDEEIAQGMFAEPGEDIELLADIPEVAIEEETAGLEVPAPAEEFVLPLIDDPLASLRVCINSIGIELSDSIIQGLYTEINGLRSKWASRPIEKTFLQLLSTIAQHIDQYRFESSSEAFGLLESVMNAFAESLDATDNLAVQQTLLAEVTKVLLWQQDMLNRQAVSKGDELTFTSPVRFQTGESVPDEKISFLEDAAESKFEAIFEGASEEEEGLPGGEIKGEPTEAELSPELAVFDEMEEAGFDLSEEISDLETVVTAEENDDSQFGSEESREDEPVSDANETLFFDLEADLAAEHAGIPEAVPEETLPFDQQIKSLIQNEFALMREEWKRELAELRAQLKKEE
jgi:pilus assembly protein FimV